MLLQKYLKSDLYLLHGPLITPWLLLVLPGYLVILSCFLLLHGVLGLFPEYFVILSCFLLA